VVKSWSPGGCYRCPCAYVVGVVQLWHQSRIIGDIMISQEVVKLQKIFKRIDKTCGIIGCRAEN